MGDTGETGDTGDAGDMGNTGDTGEAGDTGDTGETGETGDMGETGDTGDTGDTGNTGDTGDMGDTGNTGDTGEAGDTGDTGDMGDTGDAGAWAIPATRARLVIWARLVTWAIREIPAIWAIIMAAVPQTQIWNPAPDHHCRLRRPATALSCRKIRQSSATAFALGDPITVDWDQASETGAINLQLTGTGSVIFTISSDGVLRYHGDSLDYETDTGFTLTLTATGTGSDGKEATAEATVTITLQDANDAPVVVPDAQTDFGEIEQPDDAIPVRKADQDAGSLWPVYG